MYVAQLHSRPLRSSRVCGGDGKHTVDVAFGLISSPEFRAFNHGYPKTANSGRQKARDSSIRG